MQEAIERSGGTNMTESLMLALTAKGLARSEAHELLRGLTRNPMEPPPLLERAKADPTVRRLLTPDEISQMLDPASYVRAAADKTDRILARIDGALAS